MKTKEECKDEVAMKIGLKSWLQLAVLHHEGNITLELMMKCIDEAMELYAEQKWNEACETQKIICSESATLTAESCGDPMSCGCQGRCDHPYYSVNKKSILNSPLPPFKA